MSWDMRNVGLVLSYHWYVHGNARSGGIMLVLPVSTLAVVAVSSQSVISENSERMM